MEEDAADPAVRQRLPVASPDFRLLPVERARLGSRGTLYASRTVNALFNRMGAEHFWSGPWGRPTNEGDRIMRRMRIGEIVDELQKAVRTELKTDALLPVFQSDLLNKPTPIQRQMRHDAQASAAMPELEDVLAKYDLDKNADDSSDDNVDDNRAP